MFAIGVASVFASQGSVLAKDLQIGVAEFPPFKYTENGNIIGSDTEIVIAIVKAMGHTPKLKMMPWVRVQRDAKYGDLDLIFSLVSNPEREKDYHFSDPINSVRNVLFKRRGESIEWNKFSDLDKYEIGTSGGYAYAKDFNDYLASNMNHVQVVMGTAPEFNNLKKLAAKRIDLFICEVSVCRYLINKYKASDPDFERIDYIDKTVGNVDMFRAGFPKSLDAVKDAESKALRDQFNAALDAFTKTGKRTEILRRYNM